MSPLPLRIVALLSAFAAGAVLAAALALETWGGLAPCALCLLERWPYRVAIAGSLLAVVLPLRLARVLLAMVAMVVLANAAIALVHMGVEAHWWPSPLPECAAPHFVAGSTAERLAQMPARPVKPCDDPSYLIPGLPISLAAMNLIYALVFAAILSILLWRSDRRAT